MLSDMIFRGMVPREFYLLKSIKRPVEFSPEIQVLLVRIGFQRTVGGVVIELLKMCFPDKSGTIGVFREIFANGRSRFR